MKRKLSSRCAFTLIELLVVIAIIAILAAILFPVFAKAREKARQATCSSNEKQLGLAMLQYSQDYDEWLPCGTLGYVGPPTLVGETISGGWATQVYPYVKSTSVYSCPDDPSYGANLGLNTRNVPYVPVSYAFNLSILTGAYTGGATWSGTGPALSKFSSPSVTVMLCEVSGNMAAVTDPLDSYSALANGATGTNNFKGHQTTGTSGPFYQTGLLSNMNPTTTLNTQYDPLLATGLHTGGSNYLLCDGHVKWINGAYVSGGNSNCVSSGPENSTGSQYNGCDYTAVGTNLTASPSYGSTLPVSYFVATFSSI